MTASASDSLARARRTESVETPVAAAIARNDALAARRARMSAIFAGVSFEGPLGPSCFGTSPAVPADSTARVHSRSASRDTPNPAAIAVPVAALIAISCTAANRRPASSPGPHR